MNSPDSELLLTRAKAGEPDAQNGLLERYRTRLLRMVAVRLDRRLASRLDPSDVVQETLRIAHGRLSEYFLHPQASFYCWLRGIAWDRLIEVYRTHIAAEKRTVLKEHQWHPPLNDNSAFELASLIVSSSADPQRIAMQNELEDRVRRALRELKPLDQEVLTMRYLEQLTTREIAEILGIYESAVTARHVRALKRLRSSLGDAP